MINTKDYRGISGIYAITHIDSGKLYIGSAVNIGQRWANHLNLLNRNKHHSIYLQRSWNKYGIEAFSFTVLEVVNDIVNLIQEEQKWIDVYKSYVPDYGYNRCPIAGSSQGRKQSEETRKKISEKKSGVKMSPEQRKNMGKARIGTHHSFETKKKIGDSQRGIPKSFESIEKMRKSKIGIPRSLDAITKSADTLARNWIVFDPYGNEYKIHNLRSFCRDNNLNAGTLAQVAQGRRKHHKGWKCRHA